jgi:uroporphyrinogen-III synthase
MTRPRAASERFAKGIEGAEVVICPLMEIVGTGAQVDLGGVAALILTSENAVPFLPRTPLPAYCVGPRTAEAAQEAGFEAEVVGPDADALVTALIDRGPAGRLLHCHGRHVRGDIVARLTDAGIAADGIAVYDQRAVAPTAEFADALRRPDLVIPLFSPRSAALFAAAADDLPTDAQIVAMSPAVAEALPDGWRTRTLVLADPDGGEMARQVRKALAWRNCP